MRKILSLATVVCLAALGALAQDAAKVDAKHYKVVFEDAAVRVMRVHYGPHEKSPMHSHPENISDKPMDMILVEFKAPAKPAAAPAKAKTAPKK